ncbi:MAG TPA: Holliday junction resolvase RuvX [Candidatus Marinimicrobia bacterium]|nr:Holliday junction resolvase RuvX [Candidatus Neomarinimicrobiota bacterium]
MNRILAVDYGHKRVGLALSDPLKIVATPLDTLQVNGEEALLQALENLIKKWQVNQLLIGYPLGLKGVKTKQTLEVERFVEVLKKRISIPITLWDERFTSAEAKDILRQKGVRPSENKGLVDQMSARIILQEYLDYGLKR